MKRLFVGLPLSWLLVFAVAFAMPSPVWAEPEPIPDNEQPLPRLGNYRVDDSGALLLGPIEGWTTAWHRAPEETAIPIGTKVQLSIAAPTGSVVHWQDAIEVERTAEKSIAECTFTQLGGVDVSAEVSLADESIHHTVKFHVIDPADEPIHISPIKVSVGKVMLGNEAPGQSGLSYFFSDESVADLQKLDSGRYRTSLGRTVHFSVDVTPAALAPLIEWRIDGRAESIGRLKAQAFGEIGLHQVEAGPSLGESVEVETYAVRVTSPDDFSERVTAGLPVTFHAVTSPPGLEDAVTWISATKYGTASPASGRGESFTVLFEDNWGSSPDGTTLQWIGVKADHDTTEQDQEAEVQRLATTVYLEIKVDGFNDPFAFSLSGSGPGDTVVRVGAGPYRDGLDIETEILSMDLQGFQDELGPAILQLQPTSRSLGSIRNVRTDGDGNLIRGSGQFDVFPRIILPDFGLDLTTGNTPVRLTTTVTALPCLGSVFATDDASSVTLYQDSEVVGEITVVRHEIEECDCPDDADVGSWNGAGNNQNDNNCYNYGTNQQNNTYAQPGHASGSPIPIPAGELNCNDISQRSQNDGLISNGNNQNCPPNTCLVALYIWGGMDYHWYRMNDDGNWSHKMDGLPATTNDDSGNPIGGNLGGADTGNYTFCEYMCVPWDLTVSGWLFQAPPTKAITNPTSRLPDVQILTRSGVPNLGWDLTDPAEIEFIQSALADLPTVSDPGWPSLLAYTGFGIYDRTDLGLAESVRVWNGVIETQSGSSINYYADTKGLESFLKQGAVDRGLGGELP